MANYNKKTFGDRGDKKVPSLSLLNTGKGGKILGNVGLKKVENKFAIYSFIWKLFFSLS